MTRVSAAPTNGGGSARVRYADPDTAGELVGVKEHLARAEAELERLRTENIQVKTENAQRKDAAAKLQTALTETQSELEAMSQENTVLRRELLDTLKKYTTLAEKLRQFELSAASVLETMTPLYIGGRETDMALTLKQTLEAGLNLAARSVRVCDLVNPELERMGLDDVQTAKIRLALRELASGAAAMARLNQPPAEPGQLESCRILEAGGPLGAVVLSAGYRNGIRLNQLLTTGKDGEVKLHVVSVRPYTAAAVPETAPGGGILAAGMEVRVSGRENESKP